MVRQAKAVARQREHVAFLVAGEPEQQRLIGRKQALHLLGLERPGIGEHSIIGEFLLDLRGERRQPAFDALGLLAQHLERGAVVVTVRVRQGCQELSVQDARKAGDVLDFAHERRKRAAAGCDARGHLVEGGGRGGLGRPLRDLEAFSPERCLGLAAAARSDREIGDVTMKIMRALLDQAAAAARSRPCFAQLRTPHGR